MTHTESIFEKPAVSYTDIMIHGSFYAVRRMPKGTKLVKAKQSPTNLAQRTIQMNTPLTPLVGKRPRIQHRARTCMRVNRDLNA